jgi:hypothetical protein
LKAQEAKDKQVPGVTYGDVVETFKAICAHQLQLQPRGAAAGK